MSETKKPPQLTAAIAKKLLAGLPKKINDFGRLLKGLDPADKCVRELGNSIRNDLVDVHNWRAGYPCSAGELPKRRHTKSLVDAYLNQLTRDVVAVLRLPNDATPTAIESLRARMVDNAFELEKLSSREKQTTSNPNDKHDKWVYEQWNQGAHWETIRDGLLERRGRKLGSWDAVYQAAKRFAKRHNLEAPKTRKS
jgi:hypothetical protein